MKWTQGIISTRAGERLAIEPEIISASRATDIPAFHARWLLNRLSEGYCLWKNPFNPSQSQYVSFKKCRLIVFWSKNPEPLLPHLRRIEDMGLQFCFHFTINDYIAENLEPGLPPLARRIAACIDPELEKKLCPDLAAVLPAPKTQKALQLPLLPSAKDTSREKLCGCIPAKDIGTYDSCRHGCVYCYACNSKNSVLAKLRRMNVDSENL